MSETLKQTPTVQYIGNGVATEFAYLRASWEESDIYVYLGDELQTNGYTIVTENLSEGAVIRFDIAPAEGELITITRILELERTTHFEESGVFKAEVMNDELDRLVAMIQQINETANRGMLLPITVSGANTQLPTPAPGKAIIWNEQGNGFQNSKDNFDDIITNNTLLANSVAANAAKALNSERTAAQSAIAAENSKNEAAQIAIAFDNNAQEETNKFDENAVIKTNSFNSNALEKTEIIQNALEETLKSEERAKAIAEGSKEDLNNLNINLARSAMDWALLAAHNSAGVVPDNVKKMRIKRQGTTVELKWKDPEDTIIEGQVLCTWHTTYIVRQAGRWPENVEDGEIILVNSTKNAYENTPFLTIEPDDENTYYYAAFPASSEGAKNLSPRNRFGVWIYGYEIDENDPVEATCISYPENVDNRFYEKAYMDFANDKFEIGDWDIEDLLPSPCMLNYNGNIDYYIDKTDFSKKADGSKSDIDNINYPGNAMMRFPRVFIKSWRERNKQYCLFSNIKYDDSFECWPCKKADGTYTEAFFGPMFEGTKDSTGRLRSIVTNTKALNNTNAQAEIDAARLNGNGWDVTNWAAEDYWRKLFILIFKRLNSQAACGYGATASSTGLTTNTGCSVSKPGLFWGSSGASANGVKMFGMENFYAHRWRRFTGCLLINGTYHVKMTKSRIDGSTADDYNLTASGYIDTGVKAPSASESYITKLNAGKYGGLPTAVGGSSSTYYSDGMWTNLSGTMMPLSGGLVLNGVVDGVFAFACDSAPSDSHWAFGASLFYSAS